MRCLKTIVTSAIMQQCECSFYSSFESVFSNANFKYGFFSICMCVCECPNFSVFLTFYLIFDFCFCRRKHNLIWCPFKRKGKFHWRGKHLQIEEKSSRLEIVKKKIKQSFFFHFRIFARCLVWTLDAVKFYLHIWNSYPCLFICKQITIT